MHVAWLSLSVASMRRQQLDSFYEVSRFPLAGMVPGRGPILRIRADWPSIVLCQGLGTKLAARQQGPGPSVRSDALSLVPPIR